MRSPKTTRAWSWLTAYYLATPLFAYTDWLGANVRAVGLADFPEWRAAYYAACTAIGALNLLRPAWSAPLSIGESAANILLLVLSVFLPYAQMIDTLVGGGQPSTVPFTAAFITNFLISGAVAVTQFHRGRASLSRRPSQS